MGICRLCRECASKQKEFCHANSMPFGGQSTVLYVSPLEACTTHLDACFVRSNWIACAHVPQPMWMSQLDESKAYEEMVELLTTKNLELGERCGDQEATIADLESSVELSEELEVQQAEEIRELQVCPTRLDGRNTPNCLGTIVLFARAYQRCDIRNIRWHVSLETRSMLLRLPIFLSWMQRSIHTTIRQSRSVRGYSWLHVLLARNPCRPSCQVAK